MKTFYAWLLFLSSMNTAATLNICENNIETDTSTIQAEDATLNLDDFEFEELDLDALLSDISEEDLRSVIENEPPPHWRELWGQRFKLASSFLRIKSSEAKNKTLNHFKEYRQIYITGAISTASVITLLLVAHYGLKYCAAG